MFKGGGRFFIAKEVGRVEWEREEIEPVSDDGCFLVLAKSDPLVSPRNRPWVPAASSAAMVPLRAFPVGIVVGIVVWSAPQEWKSCSAPCEQDGEKSTGEWMPMIDESGWRGRMHWHDGLRCSVSPWLIMSKNTTRSSGTKDVVTDIHT